MKPDHPKIYDKEWDAIKGKTHLYRTAKLKRNFEWVAIVEGNEIGDFLVRLQNGKQEVFKFYELTEFCL